MKVQDQVDLGNGHLIEIGQSTWDDGEISVRNRYPTANGGYNWNSSSEIPLNDLRPIVEAIAERDLFDVSTTALLIEVLAASLTRRLQPVPQVSLDDLLAGVTEENCHAEVDTGNSVGEEAW